MINITALLYSLLLKHYQKMNQYISYDMAYFMQQWINNQIDAKPQSKLIIRSGYTLFARSWNEEHKEDNLNGAQRLRETGRLWGEMSYKEKQKYHQKATTTRENEISDFLIQYPYSKWAQNYYEEKERKVKKALELWSSLDPLERRRFQKLQTNLNTCLLR